jgi:hypothetical protein
MRLASWTALLSIAALAAPGVAFARPLDSLRGAKLQSAVGTLTISESHCPAGSTTSCDTVTLKEGFKAGPEPRLRATAGRPGFPLGMRIEGAGSGTCYSQSAPVIQTGPDGSLQLIGSAARLVPGKFKASRIAVSSASRGVRFAWLEPLAPGVDCNYFEGSGPFLAVPAAAQLQNQLVSPVISARVLKRSHFGVTIAGGQEWNEEAADGTQVTGRASWRLHLGYKR